MSDRIWLGFYVGTEIDRVRAEINVFWVWWSIDLVFAWVVVVEIGSIFRWGAQIACFSVSIEIDLVFVWVVDTDLISVWGVELDLILV